MKTLKTLERERLSLENDKIKNLLKSYNRTDISETTKKEIANLKYLNKNILEPLR